MKKNRTPTKSVFSSIAEERLNEYSEQSPQQMYGEQNHLIDSASHLHQIELEIQVDGLREANAEIALQLDRYINLYNNLYDHLPIGYCTIARDNGRILRANIAFAELLGIQQEDLTMKSFLSVVSEEWQTYMSEVWASIFLGDEPGKRTCNVQLLRSWRKPLWVRIDMTKNDGEQSCQMVIMNISENKKLEKTLHQKEMELHTTLQALSEGVLVLDAESAVRMCNTQAEKILGLNTSQILTQTPIEPGWRIICEDGRPIEEVFPSHGAVLIPSTSPLEIIINVSLEQSTTIGLQQMSGAVRWVSLKSKPLSYHGTSEVSGRIILLTDVSEQRRIEQRLHEYEQQQFIISSHPTDKDNLSTSSDITLTDGEKEADTPKTDYITISSATQGNIILDARKEVLYLEGADDYTLFVTSANKEYLTFGTLGKWEQRLFPQGFIRVHRSTIVNFHAIYSWHYENKNIVLNMRDGKQIRVSKSYRAYFLSYVR